MTNNSLSRQAKREVFGDSFTIKMVGCFNVFKRSVNVHNTLPIQLFIYQFYIILIFNLMESLEKWP